MKKSGLVTTLIALSITALPAMVAVADDFSMHINHDNVSAGH
jgi:hypothetical protein